MSFNAYPSMFTAYWGTFTCRLGVDFGDFGVYLSLSDVVMSLLRLTEASDWVPHPYWMYTKCFSTLICYELTYGSTLTPLHLCRLGGDLGILW